MSFDSYEFDDSILEFFFVSNSKADLFIGTEKKTFRRIPIRNKKTLVSLDEVPYSIYIIVESRIVKYRERSLKLYDHDEMDLIVENIVNSKKGRLVPLPRWADYLIKRFRMEGKKELFNATLDAIENNKIFTETLKQLRIIELKKR